MPSQTKAPTILLSIFPSFGVGGAQVRFAAIANHFGRKYRHLIISLNGGDDCMARLDPGLDVTLLPFENKKGTSLGNRARLRALLRFHGPDVLVTHNWGSIDWGLANWPPRVPHIHIEDGFGPEEAERQLPRRAWTRRLVLRNSTVVVPSRTLEKIALDIWKLKPANVRYIPNGINIKRFARADIEPVLARTDVPVIGTVAALRPEKNLVRLLEAFAALRQQRPCKLIIAGDGSEWARLEAHAASLALGDDVLFIGYRPDTERVYAAMDVFALSSDTEQMPTSVLEAMASGLPVVSTDVGDVRKMVSAENGIFVGPRSAEAMVAGISRLLGDADLRRKLGQSNRMVALRDYSERAMFGAYEALFAASHHRNRSDA